MRKRREDLQEPLNSTERYLHAIAVRQDILIEQVNSIIEHLAKKDNVATTNHNVVDAPAEEKPAPKRRAARTTAPKAVVQEVENKKE